LVIQNGGERGHEVEDDIEEGLHLVEARMEVFEPMQCIPMEKPVPQYLG
jgi:hypothetical protein